MVGWSIENRTLLLQAPDVIEHRDGRALLVWRDAAHWMVVDDPMKGFLDAFQQPRRLSELFCNHTHFKRHRRRLKRLVRDLSGRGILRDPAQPADPPAPVSVEPLPIENIAWNLTGRCNLHCRYCYNGDRRDNAGADLSAAEVIDFLDRLRPFLARRATLTVLGGEPLLDPDKLLAVCAAARRRRITPLVSTNGTRITAEFAAAAKRIGLEVQISLDGPTAALNDPLRGAGTFEAVRRGVAVCTKARVHTILSMVCTRQNVDALGDFLDTALDWGVNEARFIPLKRMGGAKDDAAAMVPHFEIITAAYRLLRDKPAYRDLLGRDCLSILAHTCRYADRRPSCGTGSQTLLLDADGTLYPCLNLTRPVDAFGHIRDGAADFEKIWKTGELLGNVRTAASVFNTGRVCFACPVKHWCLGGCRGETVGHTGDLAAPSIHCRDLRKTIIEIFWMLADHPDIIKTYRTMR